MKAGSPLRQYLHAAILAALLAVESKQAFFRESAGAVLDGNQRILSTVDEVSPGDNLG